VLSSPSLSQPENPAARNRFPPNRDPTECERRAPVGFWGEANIKWQARLRTRSKLTRHGHAVGIHHNWPARRRACRGVRDGIEFDSENTLRPGKSAINRRQCALVLSKNWPNTIHSASAADDKAYIVGHDALPSAAVWGRDGLRGRGQSIVLCTYRNPHWRHDGLVVRILALHPFLREQVHFRTNGRD
jgi:hypothetical protein